MFARASHRPGGRTSAPTGPRLFELLEGRTLLSASGFTVQPNLEILHNAAGATAVDGFTPAQIRRAYGFDKVGFGSGAAAADGSGQTIAIVDAFNDPNIVSDLRLFDQHFGLPDPPSLKIVNQTGGTSLPATDAGWAGEIALDVEWAHAIAPGADILLVEADSDTIDDLMVAVNTARHTPGVTVVSMSWGGDESVNWSGNEFQTQTGYDKYFLTPAGHAGITFVAAAGDSGSRDGVQWPASSPNVLSVGGTSLRVADGLGTYASESSWSGTTGGYSTVEPEPAYQQGVQSTGHRGTPDVAYNGDPNTGFAVYNSVPDGGSAGWSVVAGTSAGAPQWAALVAIANQGRALAGKGPLDGATETLPLLYGLYTATNSAGASTYATTFNDVQTGGATGVGSSRIAATLGYDTATGLGSPRAVPVIGALVGTTTSSSGSGSTGSTGSTGTGGSTGSTGSTGTGGSGSSPGGTTTGGSGGTTTGTGGTITGGTGGTTTGGGSTGSTGSGGSTGEVTGEGSSPYGTGGAPGSTQTPTPTPTTTPLPASPITATLASPLPPGMIAGEDASLKLRLTDTGGYRYTGPVNVTVYASSDAAVSAEDSVVSTTFLQQVSFRAGASRRLKMKLTFPNSLPDGDYFLVVQVTATNTKTVPAETATPAPMTIAPAHGDLAATFGDAPIRVDPRRDASATVTIQNLGNVTATGPLDLGVYASTDAKLDALDQLLARMPTRTLNLKPGRSITLRLHFTAPADQPAGSYNLLAVAAPGTTHPDTDASNDVAVAATTA